MYNKEISDTIIRLNNARILSSVKLITSAKHSNTTAKATNTTGSNKDSISSDSKALLWDIHTRPYIPVTERYKTINLHGKKISAGRGTRFVDSLQNKGLIKVHRINLGGRGGKAKFLELTEKGYQAINTKPGLKIGKGAGFEHGFWQYHVSEKLKGIEGAKKVTIEGNLMNKAIDILVETSNKLIAIEIAMNPEHEKINIRKDIEVGCTHIIIGCKDSKILNHVTKRIESLSDDMKIKVTLCLVHTVTEKFKEYLDLKKEDV
jgi:hypothetical protein